MNKRKLTDERGTSYCLRFFIENSYFGDNLTLYSKNGKNSYKITNSAYDNFKGYIYSVKSKTDDKSYLLNDDELIKFVIKNELLADLKTFYLISVYKTWSKKKPLAGFVGRQRRMLNGNEEYNKKQR